MNISLSAKITFLILVILFISGSIFAQTPTATPPGDDGDVVKISTNLIQLDAVVTDKKGNQVTDLKPEDFEIFENGKKQDITNFSFVFAVPENQTTESNPLSSTNNKNLPPPTSVKIKPDQVRRTYALVVDDLGLSFLNAYWVKQSLKKFVNEQMQDGDLVAILRVSGGIGALQSFTSDKRQLLAAIDKIRWNGQGRMGVESYAPLRPEINDDVNGRDQNTERDPQIAKGLEQNRQSELQAESARQANLAVGTLGALNYLIKGMRDLPGRKSLMLFSEGFQIFDYGKGFPKQNRLLSDLRDLADTANRSSVVIYTSDPRGLEPHAINDGQFDAADDIETQITRQWDKFSRKSER